MLNSDSDVLVLYSGVQDEIDRDFESGHSLPFEVKT